MFKKQDPKMRNLAIANCQAEFDTFKALLSDLLTGNDFFLFTSYYNSPPTVFLLPIFIAEQG